MISVLAPVEKIGEGIDGNPLEETDDGNPLALIPTTSLVPQLIADELSNFYKELASYSQRLYENFAQLQELIDGINPHFPELRDLVSFREKLEVISKKIPAIEQEQRTLEQKTIGLEQMLHTDDLAELRDAIRFIIEYVTHDFKGISSVTGMHIQMLREDITSRLPPIKEKILQIGGESLIDPALLKTIPEVLDDVIRAEDRERLQKIRSCINHGYRESQFLVAAANKSYTMEKTNVAQIFKEAFDYVFKVKYKKLLGNVKVRCNFHGSFLVKTHPGAMYRALYNHLNNIAEEMQKDLGGKQHQIGFNIYHVRDEVFIDIRDTCGGFPDELLNGSSNGSVAGYSSKSGEDERRRGFGSRIADNAMLSVGGIVFLANYSKPGVTNGEVGRLQMSREPNTVGAAYIITLPK